MPRPYNMTHVQDKANFYELTKGANLLSGGLLGDVIFIGLFVIMYRSFSQSEGTTNAQALAAASLILSLLAGLMRLLELIPDHTMYGCFAMAIVGFVWMRFEN